MKGLGVRIAKGLNRLMGRRGTVLGDRYHGHILKTPTEVRNAIHYIRNNHRHHMEPLGARFTPTWVDPFTSGAADFGVQLPAPRTWLVRQAWPRGGEPLPARAVGAGPSARCQPGVRSR